MITTDQVHIEQIEVFSRVGVTGEERAKPQRLVLNLTLWPRRRFEELHDDIAEAVNYSAVHVAVRDFMEAESYKLIETFAARLAAHLLKTFPIKQVEIELRKFVIPGTDYVSVAVTRSAND